VIDVEQFLMSLRSHKDANGKLKPIYLADTIKEEIQIIEEAVKYSQRWVGLTDEEIKEIIGPWGDTPIKGYTRKLFDQIESKLRDKNTCGRPNVRGKER
jgi:hypothetical protein